MIDSYYLSKLFDRCVLIQEENCRRQQSAIVGDLSEKKCTSVG